MCFDHDSRPPIPPIAGGSLDARKVTLRAADGTAVRAYAARAARPSGAGIVVLPDVRGLVPYYEDLALRFAEHGIDAVAIDWFGRTAPDGRRGPGFDQAPHVAATTVDGLRADIAAAAAHLRSPDGGSVSAVFTVGFCFGGRTSFLAGSFGLDLAGVIGFYGWPVGPHRNGSPAPADVAAQLASPVLGIFGGADDGIPSSAVAAFEASLRQAGVEHAITVYPNAPHSFFDRKADEFVRSSEVAWDQVLGFIRERTPARAEA